MKTKINLIYMFLATSILVFSGCKKESEQGPAGQDATVYYSEWVTPSAWSGKSGDWYFTINAPDITADILDKGVVLAYAKLANDIYVNAVRPLPTYAVGANWDFLIPTNNSIEFTSNMTEQPNTTDNHFRYVAISGSKPTLKSSKFNNKSEQELRSMSYKEVCKLFNIPE